MARVSGDGPLTVKRAGGEWSTLGDGATTEKAS
jgi:hypothetical protein